MVNERLQRENEKALRQKGFSEKDAVLISLKRDKDDKKKSKNMDTCCIGGPESDYPWGLEVRLETESLDKLGITDMPDVETVVTIRAKAKVTNVSSTADAKQKRRTLTLQITEMALKE